MFVAKDENETLNSLNWYIGTISCLNKTESGVRIPKDLVKSAPLVFHIFNMLHADCSFNQKIIDEYYCYSTLLKCQPLPLSLIPLETERTLLNERLLPGIMKVIRIAQNFPTLDLDPSESQTSLNELASSVFVS